MKKILLIIFSLIMYILLIFIILEKSTTPEIQVIKKEKNDDEYISNGLKLEDSNLSLSNGKEDKFYYDQLSDTAKIIYDKLFENKEKLKKGTEKIEFNKNEFDKILKTEDGMTVLSNEYQNAVDALRYDNMDFYYIDFTKMVLKTITYTQGKKVSYQVYLTYSENDSNYLEENLTEEKINQQLKEVNEKADEIKKMHKGAIIKKYSTYIIG